jgi:orotidine-5'-phosphate decarboxylase
MEGREISRRIVAKKSIVVACDLTSMEDLEKVVANTCDLHGVGGYKIGFSLALKYGVPSVVATIRRYTAKPVMYDHQKGGTDVPHTGALFSDVLTEAGVDYAILFPFSGPSTEAAWIEALTKKGIVPVVGAIMTIPDFLKEGGGYIDERSAARIFEMAASLGVKDFVLPGNKPDIASKYKQQIDSLVSSPTYYLPGLGAQGGDIKSCARMMGERWHAIVGRSVYGAKDVRGAALSLTEELLVK